MCAISTNKYIFLYEGKGSDPTCVTETSKQLTSICAREYSVINVDPSYIVREPAPAVYVLPGGLAGVMGMELRSSAEKVKECAKRGSGILAFCAGAMVIGEKWDFLFRTRESPRGEGCSSFHFHTPLGLGPSAFGPTFEDGECASVQTFKNPKERQASILYSAAGEEECKSYWAQGPVFTELARDDVIVASYQRDESINPLLHRVERLAAVVHRPSYGSHGEVVVSGIHPELARWSHENGFPLSEKDLGNNNKLFRECCTRVGIAIDVPDSAKDV